MNPSTLGTLWSSVGLALVYLNFNVWVRTQQGNVSLPGMTFEKVDPSVVAIYGTIINIMLIPIVVYIATEYARASQRGPLLLSLPSAFNIEIDRSSKIGKRYVRLFLFPLSFISDRGSNTLLAKDDKWISLFQRDRSIVFGWQ